MDGDTGQVGPSIAVQSKYELVTNVMSVVEAGEKGIICENRHGERREVLYPALVTVEKSLNLRLPSIRSRQGTVEVWDAMKLGADISRCGFTGSPTKVVKVFENDQDRRNCKFIDCRELARVVEEGVRNGRQTLTPLSESKCKLEHVWIVGKASLEMAQTVGKHISVISLDEPKQMAEKIQQGQPNAVLWGSDARSKAVAPQVAALLRTGLCADCTSLETDGEILYMYRPACSGNVIAKIKCISNPPMATIRTAEKQLQNILIGVGYGAKDEIAQVKAFAEPLGAGIVATRKMVDRDYFPYKMQAGLTGKTVSPDVYIALGISGAVHHIAGIRQSGTIIAVNSDKNAEIFKYADYGIVADLKEVLH